MVDRRRAFGKLYKARCWVYETIKTQTSAGETVFSKKATLEEIPCRLSYRSSPESGDERTYSKVNQTVKLFLEPEHIIPEGSKINVMYNGRTVTYKNTGKPAVYEAHQEINLELDRKYA